MPSSGPFYGKVKKSSARDCKNNRKEIWKQRKREGNLRNEDSARERGRNAGKGRVCRDSSFLANNAEWRMKNTWIYKLWTVRSGKSWFLYRERRNLQLV